jgi:hypothetical protein
MPISIDKDAINFGNYSISLHPEGISINGAFQYDEFEKIPIFGGETSGYASGGDLSNGVRSDTIDKFPFAADANGTDVGNLSETRTGLSGQSSEVSGYVSGGRTTIDVNTIEKFSFVAGGNTTDVGDLTHTTTRYGFGNSSKKYGYGYAAGGISSPMINIINKFPFSADTNATDVGDLTQGRYGAAGQSSADYAYFSGGGSSTNIIDKFPFAADGNATDVGDLTVARSAGLAGQSSKVSGYASGGIGPTDIIDKFPFASDANATDVGNLTQIRFAASGQSSLVSGYASGGGAPSVPTQAVNTIDKFPFAVDANATDVGDLTQARRDGTGQQV